MIFNKLSDVRGTTSVSPVQSLSIPIDPTNPSGPWHTIHDHETITKTLMENKSDHFTQATGSPFTEPSLRIPLGRHAEHGEQSINNVLYDGPNLATTQLLKALKENRQPKIKINGKDIKKRYKHGKDKHQHLHRVDH